MAQEEIEGLHRANMEASALFAAAAYITLIPQALLALGITKAAEALNIPAGPLNMTALGIFLLAILGNGYWHYQTLKKHGWCSDVHLNAAQGGSNLIKLKYPLITTIAGTIATVGWSFATNPVDWVGINSLKDGIITGQPDPIAAGTFIAKAIVPTIYAQYLNYRINNGTIAPIVNVMKKVDHLVDSKVVNPIKNGIKKLEESANSPSFNDWVNVWMLNGIGGK